MIRNILQLFIILCLICTSYYQAFSLSEELSNKQFYTHISDNIDGLEVELFQIEVNGENGNKERINEALWQECIRSDFSISQLQEIVKDGNISHITENLSENCKWKDGAVWMWFLSTITRAISSVYEEAINTAKSKAGKIENFSKTAIYADWIEGNGPFDLIKDIENIDKIVFEQTDNLKYEYLKWPDISDTIREKIKEKVSRIQLKDTIKWSTIDTLLLCEINGECNFQTEKEKLLCELRWDCDTQWWSWEYIELSNQAVCEADENSLSKTANTIIWYSINNQLHGNFSTNSINGNSIDNKSSNWNTHSWIGENTEKNKTPIPEWNYSPINDNILFPCNKVFCIDIQFHTHNGSWGWWVSSTPSIEYLLKRSNNHLRTIVNSPLSQSKQTTNNFELWITSVNLPKMFHMWVQISTKPVPILDLDYWEETIIYSSEGKEKEKQETLKTAKGQLREYYKLYGLEYERQNDLSLFQKIEYERKSVLNGWALPNKKTRDNTFQYIEYFEEKQKEIAALREEINTDTKRSIISDLEEQTKELEMFNASFKEYIKNLDAISSEMLKIPVDTSKW